MVQSCRMYAKGKPDRLQRKGWFLTYPRCDLEPKVVLEYLEERFKLDEYVIAQEDHKDGGKHIHAFIKVDKRITFKNGVFDLPEHHGNYQVAKSWKAVRQYVTKDGNYISNLDLESAKAKKGKKNMDVLTMDPKEAVETGVIRWDQLKSLVQAQQIYGALAEPYEHDDVRGLWFHGKPGTGKSREARSLYPGAYLKAQNKWWDGYTGQEAVILDDFDQQGVCLGHYIKIWADRYSCTGETKGGHVSLRHKVFVITSNYRPEELFTDREIIDAISRRFKLKGF